MKSQPYKHTNLQAKYATQQSENESEKNTSDYTDSYSDYENENELRKDRTYDADEYLDIEPSI